MISYLGFMFKRQIHPNQLGLLLFEAAKTYPGFEGNQLEDHLHCEEAGEEHVEDVHGVVEMFGLTVMLQRTRQGLNLCSLVCLFACFTCFQCLSPSGLTCMARQMVLRRMRVNIRYSK